MGVSGLHGALAPYAQPTTLSVAAAAGPATPPPRANLIIDGPALAYHVYYQLVAQRSAVGHPLRAMPSYAQLVAGVLDFLGTLESYGLIPKHVFFDGALPDAKKPTRMSRLQKYLDQMRAWRLLNPQLEGAARPASRLAPSQGASLGFSAGSIPPHMKNLPAAPFLVPAVVEGLARSKYAALTKVVPCEADLQCTSAAHCTASDYILTSDSDLILQCPPGKVVFFNSLKLQPVSGQSDQIEKLVFDAFSAADIAARANIPPERLVHVGYALQTHYSTSLTNAAKRATSLTDHDDAEFAAFRALYRPWAQQTDWASLFALDSSPNDAPALAILQHLDARIAEYIFASSQLDPPPSTPLYLPFLLDDPTRASAWRPSAPLRQLALSVWHLAHPHPAPLEIDRRGTTVTTNPITLLDPSAISPTLDDLHTALTAHLAYFSTTSPQTAWSASALVHLVNAQHSSTSLPPVADVAHLLAPDQAALSWSQLHLAAQLDGTLYSLRLLHQVLNLICSAPHRFHPDPAARTLLETLASLPPLPELMVAPGTYDCLSPVRPRVLELLTPLYGGEIEAVGDKRTRPSRGRVQKKKTDGRVAKTRARQSGGAAQNRFASLADTD